MKEFQTSTSICVFVNKDSMNFNGCDVPRSKIPKELIEFIEGETEEEPDVEGRMFADNIYVDFFGEMDDDNPLTMQIEIEGIKLGEYDEIFDALVELVVDGLTNDLDITYTDEREFNYNMKSWQL